jgi:hypothetical protein
MQQKESNLKQIDDAMERVRLKYKLGFVLIPYNYCNPERSKTEIGTPANILASEKTAAGLCC